MVAFTPADIHQVYRMSKIKAIRDLKPGESVWIVSSTACSVYNTIVQYPGIWLATVDRVRSNKKAWTLRVLRPEKYEYFTEFDTYSDEDMASAAYCHQRIELGYDDVYGDFDKYSIVLSAYTTKKEAVACFMKYYDEARDECKKKIKSYRDSIQKTKAEMASMIKIRDKDLTAFKEKEKRSKKSREEHIISLND